MKLRQVKTERGVEERDGERETERNGLRELEDECM